MHIYHNSLSIIFISIILSITTLIQQSHSAEGNSIAGISGGSDIRAALAPPPGLYAAGVAIDSKFEDFFDGNGTKVPALSDFEFDIRSGLLAALYVPNFKLAGGSLGILGVVSAKHRCGKKFGNLPTSCGIGMGDPYFEINWSRYFGTVRPSKYPNTFPIKEGLAIQMGIGTVVPIGKYDVEEVSVKGMSFGNNIWNIAPMAAFTYTSPPLLLEGSEISAKLYWNNFLKNQDTNYQTGDILSIDFALTERIGQFQFGLAGSYVQQIENDQQLGIDVGRRVKSLSVGPIIALDLPQSGIVMKLKLLNSVIEENTSKGFGAIFTFATKIH